MAKLNIHTAETAAAAIAALKEQGYSVEYGTPYSTKRGKTQMNIWVTGKDGKPVHHNDKLLKELGACYCAAKSTTTKGGREKQHRRTWFLKVVDDNLKASKSAGKHAKGSAA